MLLKSLKSKIIIYIVGIVMFSLIITTFVLVNKAKTELKGLIDENEYNLMEAIKNQVQSQYNSILYQQSSMLSRRKQELKNNISIAFSIIENHYHNYLDEQVTKELAMSQLIEELQRIRYDNGVGYFWINDVTTPYPRMIMHPTMPELDGEILDDPVFNCVINSHENLFKAMVDVCKKSDQGYVEYLWPKPLPSGLSELKPKISYVKSFKPWNWIIGTGVYIDDIDKDVQDRINAVIKDLNAFILKQKVGKSGYFFIFDEKGKMLVHPSKAGQDITTTINPATGNFLTKELQEIAFTDNPVMEYLWEKPGFEGEYIFPKVVRVFYFEPLGWYICTSVYKEEIKDKVTDLTQTIVLFSFAFFSLALISALFVSQSITKPLNALIGFIRKSDKDGIPLEKIPDTDIHELSVLSGTINTMIDTIMVSKKKLQTSEAKYRGLVESSNDWIWEVNQDFEYTYTSPQVQVILGYDPLNVIGQKPFDFMTSKEAKKLSKTFKKTILSSQSLVLQENHFIHKNGNEIILETSGVPILNEMGNVIGCRGIDRDITARKKAENALVESEEKFRLLADNSFDVIWRMDINGRFTYVNPAIEIMTGYTPDELVNMTIDDFLVPESALKVKKFVEEQLPKPVSERVPALIDDFKQYKKDGSVIIIEVSATWITDHQGNIIAIQGITRDITERKQIEEQTRKDLTEKEVMLKEIHHRVKNNLAVITGLLYLQSKRIKSKEQAFAAFEESRNRILSMALVHEQLYKSGNLASIDMRIYVDRILNELKHSYAYDNRISFDLNINDVILNINHAVPCGLILSELISNAFKHAFPDKRKGHIHVSFQPIDDQYILKIQDNGVGLPNNVDIHSDKTLGLYLISMLTKQINGEFDVSREKGTTFIIRFARNS